MTGFSFVNPHLLWALPLAAAPVVIYFLMRFRAVAVPWGADYVLKRAIERLRKKLFIDQLLLMALRTLAAAAIVLAIARPVTSRHAAGGTVQGSGVHHIVVLDDSASTLARVAGGGATTVWQRQKEILGKLVATWGRGERWSLLRAAGEPRWVKEYAEVTSPDDSARAVEALDPPGEEAAALGRALAMALAAAGDRPAEIILLADDQQTSWVEAESALPPAASGGKRPAVTWVRLAPRDRDNRAVTRLRVQPEVCLVGHPSKVEVKVRNLGPAAVEDATVEVLLDGGFQARSTTPIQPGQEATLSFTITPESAGSHAVSARLASDVLTADDEAFAGIDVRDRATVIVCRDPAKTGTFASAGGFLTLLSEVLGRKTDDGKPLLAAAPLVVETCTDDCSAAALSKADVVVADGGSRLDAALATALAQRVDAGGAVVLAPEPGIDREQWNTLFAGAGLLPARIVGGVEGAPGIEPVRRLPGSAAAFHSWLDLEPVPERSAVTRSFADGGPFAVALARRPGAVVELAAGLNGRMNNLVVFADVLPLVIDLITDAMSRAAFPRTVATGEAIAVAVPDAATVAGATFTLGDGEPQPVEPAAVMRLPGGSQRSGLGSLLLLRRGGAQEAAERIAIGVQGQRLDADLTPLSPARAAEIGKALDLTTVGSWEELDRALEQTRLGRDWQPWALALLLLALVGETALTRRFV
jgi:hypothetical protein